MLIRFKEIDINVEVYNYTQNSPDRVFFLHGFTGSSKDWDEIIPSINSSFHSISVDLTGHGKTSSPNDITYYSPQGITEQLLKVVDHFSNDKVILCGYSMGGRAALNFAVKYPEKIKGLILESSSPGIKDNVLRKKRIKSDEELAGFIQQSSIEEFVDYWMNLDLFNTQRRFSNKKLTEIRKSKLRNNRTGLANTLLGFSTGIMEPLFDKLKLINAKTLLISGELDTKFTEINSKIVNKFSNAEHVIIKNAGHNTHLEKPGDFVKAVNMFLKKL